MGSWQTLSRAGTTLALRDFGGEGPPALLVHGLAGHAEEWSGTAAWLREDRHVFALDLRGHGRSEQRPAVVSPAALAEDVSFALESVGDAPAVLLGQSLGGRIAIPVAAARPDLVGCLVVAEAGPDGAADGAARKAADVGAWLERWPVPFPAESAAEAFFGGPSPRAEAWARGLRQEADGLRPRFEVDVLTQMLREVATEDCWEEWSRIACPTLIVRGSKADLPAEEADRMRSQLPGARYVELPGVGHEVHLQETDLWRAAVTGFLEDVATPARQIRRST
jgi:pimeloyl-ACP methyl ester carboxylesterase